MATNLINKSEVRKALILQAQDTEYYWREIVGKDIRVSAATFEEAQGALQNWIRAFVARKQRKGKTL